MTNRDFGRKTVTEVQKILGIYILRARDINSKPDVAKAIVKICEYYAKKQMTLLENAGAINPVKESQLNLYESLARETKKQNEALTEENEILKKDLEYYKSIAKDNREKAIHNQNFYNEIREKYFTVLDEHTQLLKEIENNELYLKVTSIIYVVTMFLVMFIRWW